MRGEKKITQKHGSKDTMSDTRSRESGMDPEGDQGGSEKESFPTRL